MVGSVAKPRVSNHEAEESVAGGLILRDGARAPSQNEELIARQANNGTFKRFTSSQDKEDRFVMTQ
jgi:hypothetical protein